MSDPLAFFAWYVAVSAAGLLALPLGFRLFRWLPDRGFALARPLGLLTAGYVFWLLCTLGFLRNDAAGVVIAAGLVLAAGAAWLGRAGLADLWAWLRAQWGYVVGVEVVFLAAFALWAWVRAHNPEILGTEKPMEFMFINAILRSPAFPPNDAWLSGHAISYYYFGYVLMAALIRVTGVAAAVGFNLGLALLFALAATGALGVAANLMALVPAQAGGRTPDARRGPSPLALRRSFWPALLAPLMIVAAGNYYGVLGLLHANGQLADTQIPAVWYDFGDTATGQAPGVRAGLVNLWRWLDLKFLQPPPPAARAEFDWALGNWFFAARVTHDKNLLGQETEAITEMPAFSFVLGDMHPHVLALPFVFLSLALGLNWLLWARGLPSPVSGLESAPASHSWKLGVRDLGFNLRPLLPDLLVSALLLGGLGFLNTWDFPIYLFVVGLALALGLGSAWGWSGLLQRWTGVAAFALILAGAGVALYLPFYLSFTSQAGGLLPNLVYPTRFQQTAVMFAHVLIGAVVCLGWLAIRGRAALDRRAAAWAGGGLLAALILVAMTLAVAAWFSPALAGVVDSFIAPLSRNAALSLTLQRRLVDSFTTLLPAAMVGLCAGLAVGALRQRGGADGPVDPARVQAAELVQSPAVLFMLVLLTTGALLLVGPEFVYLRDNFGTRMNTIFKFYFQTWVLWGLAAAFGLRLIWDLARPVVRGAVWAGLALAIAAGLLYTYPALLSKTNRFAGPATLDGLAYFAQQYPNDWAAIQWLQANVAGAPVLAEGIGGQYWIEGRFSRISMATGLPTVMGWPGHEGQWRGRYFERVAEREGAIQQLYQARDWAAAQELLSRYGIEYVLVSDLERQKYRGVYQPKFEQFMRLVFEAGDVKIYQRLDDGS